MTDQLVYIVGAKGLPLVKIGTTTDIKKRMSRMQTGLPLDLAVLWTCPGGRDLEAALHDRFRGYNTRGEWFDLTQLGDPPVIVSEAARSIIAEEGGMAPPPYIPPGARVEALDLPLSGCARIERGLTSRYADQDECETLGLPPGSAQVVTVVRSVQYDAWGKVLAFSTTLTTSAIRLQGSSSGILVNDPYFL